MHVDDANKYEEEPCQTCQGTRFVGTCTHRLRKELIPNLNELLFEAVTRHQNALAEADRRATEPPKVDDFEILQLFHRLWGKAHDSPDYDKREWNKLSELLRILLTRNTR